MKCIFKHKWIYSEKENARFNEKKGTFIYNKRTCERCGRIDENVGFFDTSWGWVNYWVDKWVRIK